MTILDSNWIQFHGGESMRGAFHGKESSVEGFMDSPSPPFFSFYFLDDILKLWCGSHRGHIGVIA